ncbi:hypothetical protein D5R81_10085 [Parashewanella spongiae]|uniref:DUF6701 domain-containing protein n=1 Tax=Parashewanella spongiae TaxID=342950 RepID=A0A3A6TU60_9GAMM|nr:DUF6701 domain-containing protein [Parashewanella spongiae]MCL1078251.1 hypothetical protein [Parashewanella spongiae]RJY15101.1 hypothetical protein D5R81_10085 [Parashewanella spongiae]
MTHCITIIRTLLVLVLFLCPIAAQAIELCNTIFTDPPTGNHHGLFLAPIGIPDTNGNLKCDGETTPDCNKSDDFVAGDFNYHTGDFRNGNYITTSGTTTRLYFNSLEVFNANLNLDGKAEDLIIYVRGAFSMSGSSQINGLVYTPTATLSGDSRITGGLAAGGHIAIQGNATVTVEPDAIENADFAGMCYNGQFPDPSKPHHFEFEIESSLLTCKPSAVTLKACANAECDTLFADDLSANLSPNIAFNNGGWFQNGNRVRQVVIENGRANIDLRHFSTNPISINATMLNGSGLNETLCQIGNGAKSNANCQLTFADSGLLLTIDDKYANKPENATIQAVQKSNNSPQCVPAFANKPKIVRFTSDYIEPASPVNEPIVTINGDNTITTPIHVLNFNNEGLANFSINYPDAGKLEIAAQLIGSGDEGRLIMTGMGSFISVPYGFCIQAPEANSQCVTEDANCSAFKAAGSNFFLDIQAKAWSTNNTLICNNKTTPSYAQTDVGLIHQLIQPAGGELGALSVIDYSHIASIQPNREQQSVTETGVFQFITVPPAYLGSNLAIQVNTSDSIGRFVPASFELSTPSVQSVCETGVSQSYSYLDQAFNTRFILRALNVNGQVTQNYRGDFGKASIDLVAQNQPYTSQLNSAQPDYDKFLELTHRLSLAQGRDNIIAENGWTAGQASFVLDPKLNRLDSNISNGVDGPFSRMTIGLNLDDQETPNIAQVLNPDMQASLAANCQLTDSCDAKVIGRVLMRHGRLVMDNTYGPETQQLVMPIRTEYWNGSGWQTNTDDNCTQIEVADASSKAAFIYEPALDNGESVARKLEVSLNPFISGAGRLLWQSDGVNPYRGKITSPLIVPDYLQWYWDATPNYANPSASVYFGRFRGHDKIIYWREVGQ